METNGMSNLSIMKGAQFAVPNAAKLYQFFQLNLQRNGIDDKVAVIRQDAESDSAVHTTFASLEMKSNQIARRIVQLLNCTNRICANGDGDYVVTVRMEPSEKLIATLLAIWKAGAAYLPLDTNTPSNRLEHINKEVNPVLMIVDYKDGNNNVNFDITYEMLERDASVLPAVPLNPNEMLLQSECESPIAIVLYTSGSTGVPKGVRLPHNVILNRLMWQWRTFPFDECENVCVFKTALTFVDAVCEIWAPLLHATPRTLLVVPKHVTKDPEKLSHLLNTYKIHRLVLVPSLLQSMLMYIDMLKKQNYWKHDFLESLRLWVCSGEPLPVSLVKRFFTHFDQDRYRLCNFYGSTEIMGDVSYYEINSLRQLRYDDKIPIGFPVDNTTLYLLDDKLQPVSRGKMGELYVSGYNLAAGYVCGRDSEKFVSNPFPSDYGHEKLYRTGDYGKIVDDVLLYEGRTDSQIKIRGQRVDLSEIQAALNNLSVVQKSAVLCYKPGDINQAIVAFVILRFGCSVSTRDLQLKLRETLVPYAIPQVILVDNFPLLNNGKIDRQKLLKLYANNLDINENRKTQLEIDYSDVESGKLKAAKCLFETIASVLGNVPQPISVKQNFYDIGGNSLNCIQTITKLRERGYFIRIADFISAPNLACILNCMQQEKHVKENIPNDRDVKRKNFNKNGYKYEMLQDKHKDVAFKIITDSFYEKADLEQWLIPKPKRESYAELMEALWDSLVNKNLSFTVYSEADEKYVGVCLNFDVYDEPEVSVNSNLTVIFEFLEHLEGPLRKKLPIGKRQILHSFMMGTDNSLNAAQNIEVVTCMEDEILRIAKFKGFAGVFTTNTNPLTQQLGADVFKYYTLLDYQVNKYVAADGSMPFAMAPDEQRATCCWKPI